MRSDRGVFVAFEGIEGAGKSTQATMLAAALKVHGADAVLVREPGGTELAEEARRLLLHAGDELTPGTELFLFLAARADLTFRVIRPALEAGSVVIADRFELSTRAYQCAGRGLPEDAVRAAISLATGGLYPDCYVVLDLDVEAGRVRQKAQGKGPDRIERADSAFHSRVREAFRNAKGPNIVHVDAEQPAERVHAAVWAALAGRYPQTFVPVAV